MARAKVLVGQNVLRYDLPVIRKLRPGWSTNAIIYDTLVFSRLIWGDLRDIDVANRNKAMDAVLAEQKFLRPGEEPKRKPYALPGGLTGQHGLEAWGYRLGMLKGDYGKGGAGVWEFWTPQMQDYCVDDVKVTRRFWDLILTKNPSLEAVEMEHEFAEILAFQENHGFAFNVEEGTELYLKLVTRRKALKADLEKAVQPWYVSEGERIPKRSRRVSRVDGTKEEETQDVPFTKVKLRHFNPSSRQQVANRLIKLYGWEPDEFTPEGSPKVDETILEKLPYGLAPLLAEFYMVEKRIGQIAEGEQAWLKLVRDGRIHGSVNTIGAITRRCTHATPNVSQTPGSEAPYGPECRALFIPSKGWVLMGCDASGLELRCLANFLHKYDGGAFARALLEGDIHWVNVQAMGLTDQERDAHNPYHEAFRKVAKTFIYGFLYGCGDVKAGKILWDLILSLRQKGLDYESHSRNLFGFLRGVAPCEEELAKAGKRLKTRFLKRSPALARLRKAVQDKAKAQGFIMSLDGQVLKIRSPHSALNTLLQSAGALVVKKATVILHRYLRQDGLTRGADFAMVAHVHDEMQFECLTQEIAEHVGKRAQEAMAAAGEWYRFKLPIAGEFKAGSSWAATH
jgi:DNA polymerase-1